jgi:beta-phosphoglucomutase family hydrolase
MHAPRRSSSSTSSVWLEFDAVLFDLDGVITPTADVHRQAWREVFEEVLPLVAGLGQKEYREDDYIRYIDGRPRFEGVARLLEAHGVELPWGSPTDPPGDKTVCGIGNKKNERFVSILENERLAPYPGSLALMRRLKSLDIASALVSSSANALTVLAAAGIAGEFAVVVDGNVISSLGLAGKPDPDPFLEAARRLSMEPARCVVVEDAIAGVEAGRAGGFGLVVGVAREIDPERLHEAGADIVVTDLGELA